MRGISLPENQLTILLSKALSIPYLVKDTFKTALCTSVPITNREEGSRFSAVTFDAMMYVTERLIETGYPVIIEGNFVPRGVKKVDEAGVIKTLINKYACKTLTYKFCGDTHILHKRFLERDRLAERGQANRLFTEPGFSDFSTWCNNLEEFDVGGEIIRVDTTDFKKVDFESLVKKALQFVNS